MAELKKCPYCGGEVKIIAEQVDARTVAYEFICLNLDCGSNTYFDFCDEEEAIEAWNNRAYEAELRANVIDEFAEAIMVKATELSEKVVFDGRLVGDALSLDCVSDMVVEIASQMKGEKE